MVVTATRHTTSTTLLKKVAEEKAVAMPTETADCVVYWHTSKSCVICTSGPTFSMLTVVSSSYWLAHCSVCFV